MSKVYTTEELEIFDKVLEEQYSIHEMQDAILNLEKRSIKKSNKGFTSAEILTELLVMKNDKTRDLKMFLLITEFGYGYKLMNPFKEFKLINNHWGMKLSTRRHDCLNEPIKGEHIWFCCSKALEINKMLFGRGNDE